MRLFEYQRAGSIDQAINGREATHGAQFLGGGTNLLDLMKMGVEQPAKLVDITRLPLNTVEPHNGGVRIGALVRNSTLAAHPLIRSRYPILSEALLSGASPQIRNMATTGGNLLQRTRCYYFYDPSYHDCNKRAPGSGCAALHGYNRNHAILGASEACVASHPSDMAVALAVLNAVVEVKEPRGERSIPVADFHRLPGNTPHVDTNLHPGELIVSIVLPAATAHRAYYLKVRDRQSFAFALVSVAALVELASDGRIHDARFALGGVAPTPWRVEAAEQSLRGKEPGAAAFSEAAETALRGAKPLRYNGFKVELARRSIVRALSEASRITSEEKKGNA